MMRSVLASAALVATAHAVGDAIVINKCSYNINLNNVPASGGGFSEISKTLSPGDSYSQTYTQLTNDNGWSLKLTKPGDTDFNNNVLQYEYTFHNDGTIWYDLSEVNGNPWDGNWEITATNGCSPRQAAYRFATDDAYGMQSCGSDASITVTVCSGESGGSSSPQPPMSSPPESSPPPATSEAPATTYPDSAPTWGLNGDAVEAPAGKVAVHKHKQKEDPTTLATSPTSAAWDGPAVTVTNIHMETMTKYVTATAAPAKRHVHHRHQHNRL